MLPSPKVSVVDVTKTGVPVAISSTTETSRPERIIRTKRAKPAPLAGGLFRFLFYFFLFPKEKMKCGSSRRGKGG